jgi:hypothetical protein
MRMQIASSQTSLRRAIARGAATAALVAVVAAGSGCTSRQLDGAAPSYLIVDTLDASSGAEPDEFSGVLSSDVLGKEGTIFADLGRVTLRMALKDPGSQASPNIPSPTNWITVSRYRVQFIRADGRNVPGVDVPYPFDGGVTVTADDTGSTAVFTLVRVQSKLEAPLKALGNGLGDISTIAEVTFYGADQAGREVSVVGRISVNFANWADPD